MPRVTIPFEPHEIVYHRCGGEDAQPGLVTNVTFLAVGDKWHLYDVEVQYADGSQLSFSPTALTRDKGDCMALQWGTPEPEE